MASFPRTQNQISSLVKSMIAGYSEYPDYFPSADIAELTTAQDEYNTASQALADAQSAAKQAADQKAQKLEQLKSLAKCQLKKSQVDTAANPVRLSFLGWGPKDDIQSMQPPSQPCNLKITAQDTGGENNDKGILHLSWEKSAFVRARFVRYYCVERRRLKSGSDGESNASLWTSIGSAIDNNIALKDEPTGVRLEYRTRAVNKGGASYPSNTICVVL
jgi:hypothetical protein